MSGRYHDIGAFAADIANLSRIVTLHNLAAHGTRNGAGLLAMDATARTYRYLDPNESPRNRRARPSPGKGAKK